MIVKNLREGHFACLHDVAQVRLLSDFGSRTQIIGIQ